MSKNSLLAATAFAAIVAGSVGADPANRAQPEAEHAAAARRIDGFVARMTLDEKVRVVTGAFGAKLPIPGVQPPPPAARGGDGFVAGVPRLGIPDQNLIGAGLGVTDLGRRKNGQSTALPSSLALAASFDTKLAYDFGAVIGDETRRQGFNVSLGGGVNLTRDPRGGRTFEYQGEDPILAGKIIAATLRGTEAQGVVATIKHYALNDIDNGRFGIDVRMGERAMREAELLPFEIGIRDSGVGAVMCSYNLVNGIYACENPYLLDTVLKREWGFKGWVMSDWGATHSTVAAAQAGLDQEFFTGQFFGNALQTAVQQGKVPPARLDDMVSRILTQLDRVGALTRNEPIRPIDVEKGAAIALRTAEQGSVLLTNDGILPLDPRANDTIAVIGFNADKGVLSGGGSAQVNPVGGNAVPSTAPATDDVAALFSLKVWDPSSPLSAIKSKAGAGRVVWNAGTNASEAAKVAAGADVVILFVGRHRAEGSDLPDLTLGDDQEALIAAVAKANPRTVVVLETGGAHTMPWADDVKAILQAWYPGQKGGEAIANILFGHVNPSGKLPLSFPMSEADLARPQLPGPPLSAKAGAADMAKPIRSTVSYDEGPLVGYKWFDAKEKAPRFPFGHGLSFTSFKYSNARASLDDTLRVSFEIANTGKRLGTEIAQVYVAVPGSGVPRRLAGWARTTLAPAGAEKVSVPLEPLALANWDVARKHWVMPAGEYVVSVGASSRDLRLTSRVTLASERILP